LIYAAVKKIPVSLVRLLVAHWQAIPSFIVGAVGCCSIITRIADQLNLLDGASLALIEEHRPIIGYDHFSQARMLKRENDVLYKVYDNNARLRLSNPELSLYSVRTYLIDFQAPPVSERAPQRATSARMAYQAKPFGTVQILGQKDRRIPATTVGRPKTIEL
jgi:hypothetical protein